LLAIGVLARAWLVLATEGTTDVLIWADHASGIATRGLVGQYRESQMLLNHPPLAAWGVTLLWKLAGTLSVDFRIVFRAAIALCDLANVALLVSLLAGRRERWLVAGVYAIVPLGALLSAYHGNTDAVLATLLLAAAVAHVRGRVVLCGVLLGIGLAVKLPIVLAAPALLFALPTLRQRLVLTGATLAAALACYAPVLSQDAAVVVEKVFGYRGLVMFTLSSPPTFVWGLKNLFIELWGYDKRIDVWSDAPGLVECWPGWAVIVTNHGDRIALVCIVAFAFLRRRERDARGLAETLAFSFALFYALIDAWAYQYFAWALPFWLLGGGVFAWCANVFAGGYIYLLYAFVCGDALLRPTWNFNGHPNWPAYLPFFREAAQWTFVVCAAVALARAARNEIRQRARSSPT
jgi:hypothetical protein